MAEKAYESHPNFQQWKFAINKEKNETLLREGTESSQVSECLAETLVYCVSRPGQGWYGMFTSRSDENMERSEGRASHTANSSDARTCI